MKLIWLTAACMERLVAWLESKPRLHSDLTDGEYVKLQYLRLKCYQFLKLSSE